MILLAVCLLAASLGLCILATLIIIDDHTQFLDP